MKKIIPLLAVLLLCGCGAQSIRYEMPGTDGSVTVPIKDLRPPTEAKKEIFSYMLTSEAYGLYRWPDDTLTPPMKEVFRRHAFEKLGADVVKDVTIHHMVVYGNLQSNLRKSAVAAAFAGGVIAAAAMSSQKTGVNLSQSLVDRKQFESVKEEYERAYFTAEENPDKAPIYVIYIDAEINGRRVFTRTIAPVKAPEGKNPYILAVDSAIQYYLEQYALAQN